MVIYLIGSGGHSVSIREVLLDLDYKNIQNVPIEEIEGLISDNLISKSVKFVIGIGDLKIREKISVFLTSKMQNFETVISKSAYVSKTSTLGTGTAVMPGSCIRSDAVIGNHCVLNTGAVIDHECVLGDFTNIAPNATLCGKVTIEGRVDIGAAATVLPGKRICSEVIVGAGSTVISDISVPGTYVGSPAKRKV